MFFYFVIVSVILILLILDKKPSEMKLLHKKLGNPFLYIPVIGNCHVLLGNEEDRMRIICMETANYCYKNKHGMLSFWFANQMIIAVADPQQARFILKTCLSKGELPNVGQDLLGNASLFTTTEHWYPRRKMNGLILGQKFIKHFVQSFSRHSEKLLKQLGSQAANTDFSAWDYFFPYSLEVISEASLGVNIEVTGQPPHPFLKALQDYLKNFAKRLCQPWLHVHMLYRMLPIYKKQQYNTKTIHDFIDNLIKEKKTRMAKNDSRQLSEDDIALTKKSLLELMLEFSNRDEYFTDDVLREEIILLILAGSETSTTTACFTSVLLSQHEDVQEKVYDEIKGVFGDSSRPIDLEDLNKLKYLEAVIKESMRLYPPAACAIRYTTHDLELPSGLILPKGTNCLINFYGINRHPDYWGPDADQFKPERFMKGTLAFPHAYMAFSNGPRNCVGSHFAMMSLKVVMANVLRRYRLLPAIGFRSDKNIPLRLSFEFMTKHVDKYQIQIVPRT